MVAIPLHLLALVERELLLFAGVFFLLGALDEFAIDVAWAWLKITGRAKTVPIVRADVEGAPLRGPVAVLVPAWQEDAVIGDTIRHMLAAWPQDELRLYVGCYRNDVATAEAVMAGIGSDLRGRLVLHDRGIM